MSPNPSLIADATPKKDKELPISGALAAEVAHRYNNILGGVIGYLELAMIGAKGNEKLTRRLELALASAEEASELSSSLMKMVRPATPQPCSLSLSSIVNTLAATIREGGPADGLSVIVEEGEEATVSADPGQIQEVLFSLVSNARDAMLQQDNPTLTIKAGREESNAVIAITDTGCGIDEEFHSQIFNPLFTLKGEFAPAGSPMETARGVGFGLPIAKAKIECQGGEIRFVSQVGKGSTFSILLPIG